MTEQMQNKLVELADREGFVEELEAAQTKEEMDAILARENLKAEDFENLSNSDAELTEEDLEEVAGGFWLTITRIQRVRIGRIILTVRQRYRVWV